MFPTVDMVRVLVFVLLFAVLCAASLSDIRYRLIPNWSVLAVAALFVPWALAGGADSFFSSLAAAFVALALSGILYAFGLLGAGDSKLLAACGLFIGFARLPEFFLAVAMAGGVLAVLILFLSRRPRAQSVDSSSLKTQTRTVPYGVAIAVAATAMIGWPFSRNMLMAVLPWVGP